MPRYIDAENAISVLEILADKCADDKAFEQAISVLKDVPTDWKGGRVNYGEI